jgi:hypothetical protein
MGPRHISFDPFAKSDRAGDGGLIIDPNRPLRPIGDHGRTVAVVDIRLPCISGLVEIQIFGCSGTRHHHLSRPGQFDCLQPSNKPHRPVPTRVGNPLFEFTMMSNFCSHKKSPRPVRMNPRDANAGGKRPRNMHGLLRPPARPPAPNFRLGVAQTAPDNAPAGGSPAQLSILIVSATVIQFAPSPVRLRP